MTGLFADGVRLALVLGHAGVHLLDDIRADRAQKDSRDGVGGAAGLAISALDGDGRARRHCVVVCGRRRRRLSVSWIVEYRNNAGRLVPLWMALFAAGERARKNCNSQFSARPTFVTTG